MSLSFESLAGNTPDGPASPLVVAVVAAAVAAESVESVPTNMHHARLVVDIDVLPEPADPSQLVGRGELAPTDICPLHICWPTTTATARDGTTNRHI